MTKNIFPVELRKAMSCMSDEKRQLIVSRLYAGECSYTELKKDIATTKGNLNHHLSELQKAGIILNYSKQNLSSPYDSYYAIGDFGRDLIDGIFGSLKPSKLITQFEFTIPRSSSPTQGFTLTTPLDEVNYQPSNSSMLQAEKLRVQA